MALTDKQRLDRIELTLAQIATALQLTVGWRPESNFQPELGAIRDEQLEAIQREKVTS
jgi:hypothetical protein